METDSTQFLRQFPSLAFDGKQTLSILLKSNVLGVVLLVTADFN